MNINMLLGLLALCTLIFGFVITQIKNQNAAWQTSVVGIAFVFIINIWALLSFNGSTSAISFPLFSGFGISFKINEFSIVFATIASFLWLISCVETKEYFKDHAHHVSRYYGSLLVTFAGTLGVFYASDLFTLFVFFEIMSFASYLWVVHNGDEKSYKAGKSYLSYAVFGGLSLLFGIFILYSLSGNLDIANLSDSFAAHQSDTQLLVAGVLIFVGFGCKAGAFFVHDWLALAHTASPAPASGLLSGLLTKTGVYGIILLIVKVLSFHEYFIYGVLFIAVLNMLIGAIYAFFSNDLKRTLAYSSVSQIGFILWGVCFSVLLHDHNTYAAYGTVFHMINHSLIKILLFSLSGVIYQNTHTLNLNQLKGYGRDKPWLKICFAIGALSLMGVPLFSGYISKTLLHEAVVELMHFGASGMIWPMLEWLFLLAGGFTFAYMLKLFICLFIDKSGKHKSNKSYVTRKTQILLSCVAALLVVLGITPNITFGAIGEFVAHFMNTHANSDIHYFIWINLKGSLISIAIGLLLYFVVARKTVVTKSKGYRDFNTSNLTIENLVYIPLVNMISLICALVMRVFDVSLDLIIVIGNRLFFKAVNIPKTFFDGKEKSPYIKESKLHITYSLEYSLLLFGIGLLVTLVYLIMVSTGA